MSSIPRRTRGLAATLLLALVVGAGPALAQTASAALHGTVAAEDGTPVEDAVVQTRSEETGQVRTAITDDRGEYRIDLLWPGQWIVIARGPDSGLSDSKNVLLGLQDNLRLDLTLGGGLVERVEVTAVAPVFDTTRTGGELHILGEQADSLPLAGRTVTDLALLDSAVHVAPAGEFFGERGPTFVVNGQTGRSNSFLVDGVDNNDRTSGSSLGSFFSQQVIREFVVLTHQYAPEFGRASGGVLNIVTHRGGNEHHGEFFVQGAGESWSETSQFIESLPVAQTVAQTTPDNFAGGFRFGGPIKKDKAFYFMAYERQDGTDIVAWRGIDAAGNLGGWTTAPTESDNLFFRADANLTPNQFLMLRVSGDTRTSDGVNIGGRITGESGFDLEEEDFQIAGSLTSIATPRLLNELRFLAGTSVFDQQARSGLPGVNRPSGVFGGNELNQQQRDENRVQLVDNLTISRRAHTLKLGVDLVHSRTKIFADFNPSGNFLYTSDDAFEPGDCGNLLATDLLNVDGDIRAPIDCPGQVGVDDDGDGQIDEPGYFYTYPLAYTYIFGEPRAELKDTQIGLFAQDRWQVSPSWQVDYGVRYDVTTYTLPAAARVDSTIPNGGAERDTNNLAPRVGFTWTPGANGRTVIRGGAGRFYDKLVLAFPAAAAVTSRTEIGINPLRGFGFEEQPEDILAAIEALGEEGFEQALRDALFFPEELILRFSTATELSTPYTDQLTLGAEHQVGSNGSASINVIRSLGYNLPLMRDLNPVSHVDCAVGGTDVPEAGKVPCLGIPVHVDDGTGSIAAITTEGRSWYTGVDLAYRWRGRTSWAQAAYTWSESEDLGPDPLKGGIYLPPNSADLSLERGRSDSDRRHRLVLSGEFALPWLGLRTSGVVRYYAGLPYNITTGRDENLDGINSDRPAAVGRNSGGSTSLESVNQVRAEEELPLLASIPDGPSFSQFDLRVSKPFAYKGGQGRGEFFLQVFNLFDTYNEGPPEGRLTSANFGQPVGQIGPPRTLGAGFKIGY